MKQQVQNTIIGFSPKEYKELESLRKQLFVGGIQKPAKNFFDGIILAAKGDEYMGLYMKRELMKMVKYN